MQQRAQGDTGQGTQEAETMSLAAINHIALTAAARAIGAVLRPCSSLPRLSAVGAKARVCGMGGAVRLVHPARRAGGSRDRPHDRYGPGLHHLAFSAEDRRQIDAFRRDVLLPMHATVLHPPRIWPQYGEGYCAGGTLPGPAQLHFGQLRKLATIEQYGPQSSRLIRSRRAISAGVGGSIAWSPVTTSPARW